jgi:phosphoribosylanthranilate isomerase
MKIKVCGNTLPQQVNSLDDLEFHLPGLFFIRNRRVHGDEDKYRKDEADKRKDH